MTLFFLQRVHIDIQVGEHAIDYNQVAKKEKLSELQLRIRQLLDQVDQITKEQGYQRVSRTSVFCSTKSHVDTAGSIHYKNNLTFLHN